MINRVDRRSQLECLKQCGELLKQGASVLFFPEGTRSKDGRMHAFKKGAFSVAAKAKVCVDGLGCSFRSCCGCCCWRSVALLLLPEGLCWFGTAAAGAVAASLILPLRNTHSPTNRADWQVPAVHIA